MKDTLVQEVDELKRSIALDLEGILSCSKIKYFSNPSSRAYYSYKYSIHFRPSNDDERDQFIDLMIDELAIRGLPPTGELEELYHRLLQEVVLENKLKLHLDKLKPCNALEACLIALLHKIPCILYCGNRMGIKLLTMLLIEGFSSAQKGTIFFPICVQKIKELWRTLSKFKQILIIGFWEMMTAQLSGIFRWTMMAKMLG